MSDPSSESNPGDEAPRSDEGAVAREATHPASARARAGVRHATPMRKALIGGLGVLVLAALLTFGIPYVHGILTTVSTDDAYVNGHVTFVAPRVAGEIARVLVDDNNRVRKGDIIAELDKEPFEVAVLFMKRSVAEKGAHIGSE
jgi:membrane fusion protein (multidrug efflux system)